MSQSSIESSLKESRVFPPPAGFAARAEISSIEQYRALHAESLADPERFWLARAEELFWFKAPERALVHTPPHATWFAGGTTNLSYNCLDRHALGARKNQAAIIWEGEPQRGPEDARTLTYGELHLLVSRFANALRGLGVEEGDRVAIYMGMVPEIVVAMLACARIGAVHTVIFGGFAPDAIRDRVNDAGAKVIVTCDGGYRRGQPLHLKPIVDAAIAHCPSVRHVVVFQRLGGEVAMAPGRDHYWQDLMAKASPRCDAVPLDAEHPLFILYTSGTTGKPKGVVHTTGGYMVQAALTTRLVFDLKEGDTYFCTADVGWVTGHSYIAYGPLCNGATVMMYEGAPNFPGPDRLWDICERHRVSIFYTAPTAIRAFMRWGDEQVKKHDLSSLRLLGTVGEPINPEAWMWYHRTVGGERCPIVDTWWQTETGAIMIAPLPGAIPTVPGSATLPFFGVDADVVHKDGAPCAPNEGGYLVIKRPWPSMLRTIFGDDERFQRQYFSDIPGVYFTGDGARRDERGYFWIMGRVDDVVNVSGHRLGTAEIESALVSHPAVAEAAVVGRPDDVKGQALVAFVSLRPSRTAGDALAKELGEHVGNEIGKFAKPDAIRFTDALPKTRSGKIMRRLLKELASGGEVKGDTTTLEDMNVLKALAAKEE